MYRINRDSNKTPYAESDDTEKWCSEDVELYSGVSGWNACAGGFNRGRGCGHGDSIVALQLGLVRVSRLATARLSAESVLVLFPLSINLISWVARGIRSTENSLPFFSEDFAEIFRLTIDHLSDFTGATTTDATYVFESWRVFTDSSLSWQGFGELSHDEGWVGLFVRKFLTCIYRKHTLVMSRGRGD